MIIMIYVQTGIHCFAMVTCETLSVQGQVFTLAVPMLTTVYRIS